MTSLTQCHRDFFFFSFLTLPAPGACSAVLPPARGKPLSGVRRAHLLDVDIQSGLVVVGVG
jgi:hypothetical protein